MNEQLRMQRLGEIKNGLKYNDMEVMYGGRRQKLAVYEIPLDALIYNKYNGRIASMVKSFERQHHELDATMQEDRKIIEGFLWKSNAGRNKHTKEDLRERQQLRYGIVTRDGVIIDGNRRALLLRQIAEERHEGPGNFLAVILEDTLAGKAREIMRLETTYQMGEDEKLGYNAIEKYLRCKDLEAEDFEVADIAKMMSEDSDTIENWLRIMDLMDSYLASMGYEGIYTRLDDTEGLFVDLDGYLHTYNKKGGTKLCNWAYQSKDVADLQAIFFDLIRARFSGEGKKYRLLGRPSKKDGVFCNEPIWREFRKFHFKSIEPITDSEKPINELREENPGKDLDELLRQRDKDWTELVLPKIKENFGQSERRLEDYNSKNAPLELLNRALKTLETIETGVQAFWDDPKVETAVNEINSLTYEFKKVIKHKGH
jgi:hypothetical protein